MICIYLCDDDDAMRGQIQKILERKILIEEYDMRIVLSVSSAGPLLEAVRRERGKRGVYFLDVELKDGEWDGFLLGRQIRRFDPHATLVYITGFGDLAYRTFRYHLEAFDYIVKDPARLEEDISRCLSAVTEHLLDERCDPKEIYTVRSGDVLRHIPVSDILFFETAPAAHHIYLHTARSRIEFLGSLDRIEAELGERFFRAHRSYLVAVDKIEEIDIRHGKLRAGGRECLVSRKARSALLLRMGGES